jgi:thioesterase domain-containing protein
MNRSSRAGRIVTLARSAGGPAFVIIPGAGGGFSPYLRLAARIGATHDVHVIRAAGLLPGEQPERTIASMASSARGALDAATITPDVVFGWSLGGTIAWELCVLLEQCGERPDLILLDSPTTITPAQTTDPGLFERVLAMLGPRPAPAVVERVRRTVDAQLRALAGHRPSAPYGGRVLVLTCSRGGTRTPSDAMLDWRSLAPGLRHGQLDADHFGVFDRVHLPELVAEVNTFLCPDQRLAGVRR